MVKIYNALKDPEEIKKAAASDLSLTLEKLSSSPTLLLLSGGSSFEIYEKLKPILESSNHDWSRLSVTILDERFDPQNSNYLAFQKTDLYKYFVDNKADVFGIEDYEHDPKMVTSVFNTKINEVMENKPKIVIFAGMGADGHISGIMPYPDNKQFFEKTFIDTQKPYTFYDARGKNEYPLRITSTIPFLEQTDYAFSYIVGENKLFKLQEALKKGQETYKVPFSLVQKFKSTNIYTDLPVRSA